MLKVSVTQAPEKARPTRRSWPSWPGAGAAQSQILLQSGDTSGQKRFLIAGISLEELAARIRPFVDEA